MSNWEKLKRSTYETGQTMLMFMFENKIERPAYERGHTMSMLNREKRKRKCPLM